VVVAASKFYVAEWPLLHPAHGAHAVMQQYNGLPGFDCAMGCSIKWRLLEIGLLLGS